MKALELRVPPLLVWCLFSAAGYGLSRLLPALSYEWSGTSFAAATVALLGVAIAVAGVAEFRRVGTTVHPQRPGEATTIVSGGVYRWTRNPMYLGFLLLLAACVMHASNVVAVVVLPTFVAYLNRFQIGPEERILQTQFGAPYADYRATVRRWL